MENTIIICEKEEYLPRVTKFLNDNNIVWKPSYDKFNIKNSHWNIYKENTGYFISKNYIQCGHIGDYNINKDICYSNYKKINAKDLPEVETEELNLCELLKDCKGMEFYSSVYDNVILSEIYNKNGTIVFNVDSLQSKKIIVNNKGHLILDICQGIYSPECIIFPSKDQRDWNKFVAPVPNGTPLVVSDNLIQWIIGYSCNTIEGVAAVDCGRKEMNEQIGYTIWKYMIPFDMFDPNNIKKSLKYNIKQ